MWIRLICRKDLMFLSNSIVQLIMKYFTLGGRIKPVTVNWKYDIRGQATSGLTVDNLCFADNHNPAKKKFSSSSCGGSSRREGRRELGYFYSDKYLLLRSSFTNGDVSKTSLPIPHPANYISVCSNKHCSAKSI